MKSVERFLLPPYLWGHRNIHFSLGNRWLDHPRLKKLRMGLGIQFGKLEMGVNPKIGGKNPKMDGENKAKPYVFHPPENYPYRIR